MVSGGKALFCAFDNPLFQRWPENPCVVKNMQKIINVAFLLLPDYDMKEQVRIPVLQVNS